MDSKNLRVGFNSSIVALLAGAAIGTFGGWLPLVNQSENLLGKVLIGILFSVGLTYLYSQYLANFLPGTALLKGVLFGILVWIAFLIVGNLAFFKEAVYPAADKERFLFLSLVVHLSWGAALGVFQAEKN